MEHVVFDFRELNFKRIDLIDDTLDSLGGLELTQEDCKTKVTEIKNSLRVEKDTLEKPFLDAIDYCSREEFLSRYWKITMKGSDDEPIHQVCIYPYRYIRANNTLCAIQCDTMDNYISGMRDSTLYLERFFKERFKFDIQEITMDDMITKVKEDVIRPLLMRLQKQKREEDYGRNKE